MLEKKYNISAIVRSLNSAQTLSKTLLSLRIQSVKIAEIVLVDSGSSDSTLQIGEKFGCRIIHYPRERFNYSKALNLGIREASGTKLLIISSHTVLAYKNVVELMCLQLDHFHAAGAFCACSGKLVKIPKMDDPLRGQLVDVIHEDVFDGYNGLRNPCSLIERESWCAHPFDESLPAAEDEEWALWHYRNTRKPTVYIRNAGVLYLNPYFSKWKAVREHSIIAQRIRPEFGSWKSIIKTCLNGIRACMVCRFDNGLTMLWMAFELARSKIFSIKYESRYRK